MSVVFGDQYPRLSPRTYGPVFAAYRSVFEDGSYLSTVSIVIYGW